MSATLVLYNGHITTLDDGQPSATAIAMRDDRILALGDDDAMRALRGAGGRAVDLDGRRVTPGLVDAHVHFRGYALSLRSVDLMGVPSLDAALRRVAARAAEPAADPWLRGRGWTQDIWEGRAFPTAAQLDRVTGDRPALLNDKSGHAAWANSAALRLAGVNSQTPDPPGGAIQRDENGAPTGILFESAIDLVAHVVPPPTTASVVDAMKVAQERCWRGGLVGVHDFDGRSCFVALQEMRLNGDLGLRVLKNIPADRLPFAAEVGLRSGFGDAWLRIGGVKIFADGALGPRTALMIEPYEGEPSNRGIAVVDKEEMQQIAGRARQNGLSVTVHAIGDRAVHDVLDVYEAIQAEPTAHAPRLRNRIEHVQLIHPLDQPRLAALDVIASMQPIHATSDMEMADRYWGDRAVHSYAIKTMLDSGALVVFGSDAPVEPIEPLLGLHAAVSRQRPDGTPGPDGWYGAQRFTFEQALRAFTLAAAETSGEAAVRGTLTPGKLADLTIFERDPFGLPPDELLEAGIAGTVVGGVFRHRTW